MAEDPQTADPVQSYFQSLAPSPTPVPEAADPVHSYLSSLVPQVAKAAAENAAVTPPQPSAAPPPVAPAPVGPPAPSHAAAPGELSDFQKLAAHHLLGLQASQELQDPNVINKADWDQMSLAERMKGPDIASELDLKNPYAVGAANVGSGLLAPKTSAIGMGAMLAPGALAAVTGFAVAAPIAQGLIAGGFTLSQLGMHKQQIAEMQQAYQDQDWYTLKQKAAELGVSLPMTILGSAGVVSSVKDGIRIAKARVASDPPPQPVPNDADALAAIMTPAEASAAMAAKIRYQQQQAAIEARMAAGVATQEEAAQHAINQKMDQARGETDWDPMLPKPYENPQTPEGFAKTVELMKQGLVRTPKGDDVRPNDPVSPILEPEVQAKLTKMGADINDPQSIADVLADEKMARFPHPESYGEPVPGLKPVWKMTSDELDDHIQSESASDQQKLVQALGEGGAREFNRLYKMANRADGPNSDAAQAKIDAIDARMTPEQQRLVYGIGEDLSGLNVDELKQLQTRVGYIGGDSPAELGDSIKWAITRVDPKTGGPDASFDSQLAWAQLNKAFSWADEAGWDKNEVLQEALKAAGQRFADPEDAAFMLRNFIKTQPAEARPTPLLERPTIKVDPRLVVSQTDGNEISIPVDASATAIVHELEHFGDRIGANDAPSEGSQDDTALKFITEGKPPDRGTVLAERLIPGFQEWQDQEPIRYNVNGNEFASDPSGLVPDFYPKFSAFMDQAARVLSLDPRVGTPESSLAVMGKMMGARLRGEAAMALNAGLDGVERKFSQLTPDENYAFIDRMKANEPQPQQAVPLLGRPVSNLGPNPGWMQAAAKAMFDLNESMWKPLNEKMGLAHRGSSVFQEQGDRWEADFSGTGAQQGGEAVAPAGQTIEMKYLPPGGEGYFRAIWKGMWDGGAPNKGKFIEFGLNAGEGNSPPQGSMMSFHQASGMNMNELMAVGYEPRYTNAMTMFKAGYMDKAKTNGMWDGSKEGFDNGAIVRAPRTAPEAGSSVGPAGFIRITDPTLTNFWEGMRKTPANVEAPVEASGDLPTEYHGYDYWVEPRLAQLMKNVFSKNSVLDYAPTKTFLGAKIASTGVSLLSAIPHALNTALITWSGEIGSAMSEIYNQGIRGEGTTQSQFGHLIDGSLRGVEAMMPGLAVGKYLQRGNQFLRIISTPEEMLSTGDAQFLADNPAYKEYASMMFDSGQRATIDALQLSDAWPVVKDALNQGQYGRMVAGVIGGGLQTVGEAIGTRAIFKAVATTKLIVGADTYANLKTAYAEKIASGEMSLPQIARLASDQSHNALGQVPYKEAWFWNSTLSSVMQMFVNAPGWTVGELRIPGIAATSALSNIRDFATGDSPKGLRLDPRTAFPIGLLLTQAVVANSIQYSRTGTLCSSLLDLAYPQIGGLNDRGQPNRMGIFGYFKNWIQWANDPQQTASNKFSGIIARAAESQRNSDFYGQRVYEPTDSAAVRDAKSAAHTLVGAPIAFSSAKEAARRSDYQMGDKPTPDQIMDQVMSTVGYRPAPQGLENGPADDSIDQMLRAKRGEMGIEPYQYDDRQQEMQWIRKLRTGGPDAQQTVVSQVQDSGGGPALMTSLKKRAQMDPKNARFSLLTLPEMSQVWDQATAQEKTQWRRLFAKKIKGGQAAVQRTKYPIRSAQIVQQAAAKLRAQYPAMGGQAEEPAENETQPAQ